MCVLPLTDFPLPKPVMSLIGLVLFSKRNEDSAQKKQTEESRESGRNDFHAPLV